MRMAKASKQDIDALWEFLEDLSECFPRWGVEKDDDEIAAVVRQHWPKAGHVYTRVVLGCGILIDNACDPNLDYLDWKPEIASALHAADKRYGGEPNPFRSAPCRPNGSD